jgi:hypothetical protein
MSSSYSTKDDKLLDNSRMRHCKIIYNPKSSNVDTTKNVEKMIDLLIDSDRIEKIYSLFLVEPAVYSIYVEFDHQKQLPALKRDIKKCDIDLNEIVFKKVTGSKITLMNNYIKIGLIQGKSPFVYYSKRMELEMVNNLLQ